MLVSSKRNRLLNLNQNLSGLPSDDVKHRDICQLLLCGVTVTMVEVD